jgi:hypothetical protein
VVHKQGLKCWERDDLLGSNSICTGHNQKQGSLSQIIKHAANAPKTLFNHIIWLVTPLNTTKGRIKNVDSTQYCNDKENKRNKDVSNLEFGHPRCVCNNGVKYNEGQKTTKFIS